MTTDIRYFAHAAVGLVRDGLRLVVDPYQPGGFDGRLDYDPIDRRADFVLSTHDHADHRAFDAVPGDPLVVDDRSRAGPFRWERHRLDHDEFGGRVRGGSVDAIRLAVGDSVIVHLSDVGQSPDPSSLPEDWRGPDVLLVPVGGFYTAGAAQAREWIRRLGPRTAIPVHYGTPDCGLPLQPADPFLARFRRIDRRDGATLSIGGETPPLAPVTRLRPACAAG